MSRGNATASGGGGGCLVFFVLVALIAGAYGFSTGMDPRESVGYGLEVGAWLTGALCLVVALAFAALIALKAGGR